MILLHICWEINFANVVVELISLNFEWLFLLCCFPFQSTFTDVNNSSLKNWVLQRTLHLFFYVVNKESSQVSEELSCSSLSDEFDWSGILHISLHFLFVSETLEIFERVDVNRMLWNTYRSMMKDLYFSLLLFSKRRFLGSRK